MKSLLLVLSLIVSTPVFAAASQQGCESSGNQAAGCGENTTVSPTISPNITVNPNNTVLNAVNNQVRNENQNDNRSEAGAIGIGGGATQTQSAAGGAGGAGGSGGNGGDASSSSVSSSGSSATNAGNNQSVTFTSPPAPEKVTVKTVGEAPTMITTTTANCRVAIQASAGWLGGAFGFGTSVLDEGCDAREDARLLNNMGLVDESILRLCAKPEMAKALGKRCPE